MKLCGFGLLFLTLLRQQPAKFCDFIEPAEWLSGHEAH